MTSFIHRRAPLITPRNCVPGRERLNSRVIMRATKLFRPCGTTSVHGWNKGRPFEESCPFRGRTCAALEHAGQVRHLNSSFGAPITDETKSFNPNSAGV